MTANLRRTHADPHGSGRRWPSVSVVIPTLNEARNLPLVLAELPLDYEVVIVDGDSTDGTVAVARELRPGATILRQRRKGKGDALARGFAAATGDIVVMLDADGSADPGEIERYVAALVAGADFAKGTRFAEGGGSADITRVRAWGNRWLNRIANAFFGTRYTDLCYGYNAFWAHCLPALELDPSDKGSTEKLWGDGFEIETLINTRIAKAGLVITEVPSYEAERLFGQSNLNTWRDGFRVLRALLVERFNGKGRDVEIVRTEARDVAPVIALPVRMHSNRVIQPLDVPAGTRVPDRDAFDGYDPESYDPGPLARALMALDTAGTR